MADPDCRLEELDLSQTNVFKDKGMAALAEGLRNNQRLTTIEGYWETGFNAFRTVLCDRTSINATHGSNHTFQSLGGNYNLPQDIKTMLELNSEENKSLVAATKILLSHRHLDMKPLFDRKMDLLPHVVAWLERFAESRLDLKLPYRRFLSSCERFPWT